jgi:hypothetical protein
MRFESRRSPKRKKCITNKKVMSFEIRRDPKRRKKKEKNMFCKLKSLFFFLLFCHYSFALPR